MLRNMKNSRKNKECKQDTRYRMQDEGFTFFVFCIISILLLVNQCFAEEGKSYLESGIKAYNKDADFDKTISEIKKAIQIGLKDKSDQIQAHLHLGFAYIAKGKRIDAVVEFAKAINLDPEINLDPKTYSSKIISVFNETKQSLVDSLTVVSNPGGADVFLDGKKVGVTPVKISGVLVGERSLTIVKDYYQPKSLTVQVYKAEENRVEVQLEKAEVEIMLNSMPTESTVYIDNNPLGKTPLSLKISLDKELNVKLSKEEYLDKELKIRLLPNGVNIGTDKFFAVEDNIADVTVELTPAPAPGSLKIITLPPDAIAYLDGIEIGKTPLTIPKVTPGNREIRVSIPNFDNLTKKVSVVSNKETVVEILLGGIINFSSVPSDAQIYLDGKYLGQTPFKSDRLPIGSHQVRFTKEKYKDKNITAILERGQEMEVNVRLIPQKGSLAISSDPTEAEVYLDGKLKGKTPLTIYGLLIGKYSLKIIKPGYEDYSDTVDIGENDLSWHFAKLVKI